VSSSPGKSPPSSRRSSFYVSPILNTVFYVATIIIAVVGCVANAYVLMALLRSKTSRKSHINVFITHQTVLDLTSCTFLLPTK